MTSGQKHTCFEGALMLKVQFWCFWCLCMSRCVGECSVHMPSAWLAWIPACPDVRQCSTSTDSAASVHGWTDQCYWCQRLSLW